MENKSEKIQKEDKYLDNQAPTKCGSQVLDSNASVQKQNKSVVEGNKKEMDKNKNKKTEIHYSCISKIEDYDDISYKRYSGK